MIRLIRAIFVGLLVASLAASGAATAHAKIASEAKAPEHAAHSAMLHQQTHEQQQQTHAQQTHEQHQQTHEQHEQMHQHHQHTLAADDEHCPHASQNSDTGQPHSHHSNECKNCCIACIIHGVMPAELVAIPASAPGDTIYQSCKVLSGVIASADPGIPKI